MPAHPASQRLVEAYLFWPGMARTRTGRCSGRSRTTAAPKAFFARSIPARFIATSSANTRWPPASVSGLCVHSLRATAATNALEHYSESRKCRSGSATPTSRPPGSTTEAVAAGGQPDVPGEILGYLTSKYASVLIKNNGRNPKWKRFEGFIHQMTEAKRRVSSQPQGYHAVAYSGLASENPP